MMQEMAFKMNNVQKTASTQSVVPVLDPQLSSWENNFEMDKSQDPTATGSFQTDPSAEYAFPIQDQQQQNSLQEDFLMGDFLKTGLTPRSGLTPRTGFTPYGFDSKQAGTFDQSMWDYFSLDDTHSAQIIAPQDLATSTTSSSTPTNNQNQPQSSAAQAPPQDPNVKIPKKRGRKRKQLDEKTQVEERKKFLERNRVAANRCRERKKTYVSNLEGRQKEVLARNQYLHVEVESLREEIAILKQLVHVECPCSEETLEHNLRQKLGDSGQSMEDVEEVVRKFKTMRASGDTSGKAIDVLMREMAAASPSSASGDSSMHDELFSVVGDEDDEGRRASADSSPAEGDETDQKPEFV